MKNTKNLVMAVANDSGNGFSKTYTQFEDGTNSTTVTPSLYANVSGKETIPELGRIDLGELDNNMDVMIKSPALKTASELLVGKAAVNSGNAVTAYNVEANTGKAETDITIIIPLVKIAYAALNHVLDQEKNIPNTINVQLAYYLTCLPISEFNNKKKRDALRKKLIKGKHIVLIKNFSRDVKIETVKKFV